MTKDQIRERTMEKFSVMVHHVTSEPLDVFSLRMQVREVFFFLLNRFSYSAAAPMGDSLAEAVKPSILFPKTFFFFFPPSSSPSPIQDSGRGLEWRMVSSWEPSGAELLPVNSVG
jgi:hypothetical protein